jgi:transposase-like protein
VLLVVLWRLRYKLSLRDLAEMFLTRGFTFTHETVRDWEERFGPLLTERLRAKRQGKAGRKWHCDETYVKVDGRWSYLYRAIDADGNLVDSMLSETRDMDAAKRFFARARTVVGHTPEKVTTDGHDADPRAIRETLGPEVRHCMSRYMNNRMEQDHRGIKQRYYPMHGFGSFDAAARFCTAQDELRDHFHYRRHMNETVSLSARRQLFQERWDTVCALLQAA